MRFIEKLEQGERGEAANLNVKLYSADKTKENNSAFLGRKIRNERILNYATQTKTHEQSIIDLRIREITSLDADG